MEASSGEAGVLIDETDKEEFSIITTIKNITTSIAKFLTETKGVFEAYSKDAVNYLMIFLVANILIPIATVLGVAKLAKYCMRRLGEP